MPILHDQGLLNRYSFSEIMYVLPWRMRSPCFRMRGLKERKNEGLIKYSSRQIVCVMGLTVSMDDTFRFQRTGNIIAVLHTRQIICRVISVL